MTDLYVSHHTVPDDVNEREKALQQLDSALAAVSAYEYAKLWVDHNAFPALCGLIHGERGWLMLIRYDGDAGYSSRASDEASDSVEEWDFLLGNGQRDRYPLAWTIPRTDVLHALAVFAASRQVPTTIQWHNDAQDASAGPNDERYYRAA